MQLFHPTFIANFIASLFVFLPIARAEFEHPVIAHNQSRIDFVKSKIASGEEPRPTAIGMLQTMLAMGVYLDDQAEAQKGMDHQTGVVVSPPAGRFGSFVESVEL